MAIPPRPSVPIFQTPIGTPALPAIPGTIPAPVASPMERNGRSVMTSPVPNADGSYPEGTPLNYVPAKQKFDWAPYANGSWLNSQFAGNPFFQQLIAMMGGGAAPAPAPAARGAAPVPAPAASPAAPFDVNSVLGGNHLADYPMLAGLFGRQNGPLVPPPNFNV